ncbi:DNA primase [Adhaeribacter arboris]|uniref:DNA primase n=1 Tax=Adhaeribacter arboris TaxID=2072846 RepID=A0A2T2YMJ6_9BACT|nr:DNA primase [Adhaeribacter arboris]PSR56733.1 DNA primase [Adhaeribacter arboris]
MSYNKRISNDSIQKVKQVDIVSVVGAYLPLKTKGTRHQACCPFHAEKTPSFSVNASKQIFKCFGCGAVGDGIAFVQKKENLGFYEAVQEIAQKNGISLEYEDFSAEQQQEAQQAYQERKSRQLLLEYALAYYQAHDIPPTWMKQRRLQETTLLDFKVAYALAGKNQFYQDAIAAGYPPDQLIPAGLAREVNLENTTVAYDYFQDRILFPIHNYRGQLVAFTGRLVTEPAPDATYKPPKYLNSPDSVWTKGDHLYGLHLATKAIQEKQFAYLVEGNVDVLSFYQADLRNTVAPCGTAFTLNQCQLLKKYTDTVVMVPDHDMAGLKALHKNAQLLIEQGFIVRVLLPGKERDPDEQIRKLITPEKIGKWLRETKEYISGYLLEECQAQGCLSPHEKAEQITRMGEVLELIEKDILRNTYFDEVCERWPDFKKNYKLQKRKSDTDTQELAKLESTTRAAYFDFGYYEKDGCYYTYEKKQEVMICNFTIEILYFVLSENEPKYVCIFRNMFGKVRTTAVSTDDFTGVGTFKRAIGKLGAFIFDGTETHLNKIKMKLFDGVIEAVQPRYMGYNSHGDFYTWANGLFYNGHFIKSDKYGIVPLKIPVKTLEELSQLSSDSQVEVNGQLFFFRTYNEFLAQFKVEKLQEYLPAGRVYQLSYYYLPFSTTLKLNPEEDDTYELERMFRHFEKPGLTFERWSRLLVEAYGNNGKVMVCFFLAALYRDIIFKENSNYFPLLDHFGPRGAGKSKGAESLAAMFGEYPEDGVNLEGGSTATGIRRYLASVRNGLIWLNEYKNTASDHLIGMLKGIADGSGKMTGRATGGNETKNYKPQSAALLCGQDLPTKDPALLSRTIISEFNEQSKQTSGEAYQELKQLEKDGYTTSVTCQMLQYRSYMKHYRQVEPSVSQQIRAKCREVLEFPPDDRAVLNISTLLTTYQILSEQGQVKFPFTYEDIQQELISRVKLQVEIQTVSDDVEQYLFVLQSIREVREGEHYKIQREADGVTKLFLRTKAVHNFYLATARTQNITPLGISTIRVYLEKHRSFLEARERGVHFPELANTTSAIVLNYDLLRRQGIEFQTKANLQQLTSEDDPSAKLSRLIKLNGNAPELITEFVQAQPLDQWLSTEELLADFNYNKSPKMAKDKFMEAINQNAQMAPGRQYDFSDKSGTMVRFKQYF